MNQTTRRMWRAIVGLIVAVCGLESLSLMAAEPAEAHASSEGFTPIFDGTSLEGWDGDKKFWSVQDGAITGKTTPENPTEGNTFLIWRKKELGNFILRARYKIVGGNSGFQYRSKDLGNHVVGGYQADIDSGKTFSGILYEEREKRGVMAERGQVVYFGARGEKMPIGTLGSSDEIQSVVKPEEWNDYMIIADGMRLTHFINGRMTVHVYDDDKTESAKSGVLALQLHAGPPMTVQFKNLEIMEIPEGE